MGRLRIKVVMFKYKRSDRHLKIMNRLNDDIMISEIIGELTGIKKHSN